MLLVLFGGHSSAVIPAPQSLQTPMFRSTVDLVAVDVQVVGRDGAPIDGLGIDDFGHFFFYRSYLSLQGLMHAVAPQSGSYCSSCYTGRYPVEFPRDEKSYLQLALKLNPTVAVVK